MTEDLRGLLRDELHAERPPPLGDLVAVALDDGRRIRRRRRLAALGGAVAVAGVLTVTVALGGPTGLLLPGEPAAPAAGSRAVAGPDPAVAARPSGPDHGPRRPPPGRPVPSGPVAHRVRATPEAMLVLLEKLLPPGPRSAYAKTGSRELHVQLYLDRGEGPGMIRVSVSGSPRSGPRTGTPAVTVDSRPDNCIQRTVVRARWPDGLTVQADLATCLAGDGRRNPPSPPALTKDEARAVVVDPRWGTSMDAGLVRDGAERFPHVAYFG